jgi:hypothetical protein
VYTNSHRRASLTTKEKDALRGGGGKKIKVIVPSAAHAPAENVPLYITNTHIQTKTSTSSAKGTQSYMQKKKKKEKQNVTNQQTFILPSIPAF